MANGRGRSSRVFKRGIAMGLKLLAALALLFIGALLYLGIPRNAAGMAAKGICSAAFVAGRPWQNLMAQDVLPASPVLKLISVTVDEASLSVSATFAGLFRRTAMLLPNRGCVLDLVARDAFPTPVATPASTTSPWPISDAPLARSDWGAGVDAAALQKGG